MNTKTGKLIICILTVLVGSLWPAVARGLVINLDTSAVPGLSEWGQTTKELVAKWYPRVSNLLATKDYEPTQTIQITLRNSDREIADTSGNHIRVSSGWVEKHPEDIGLVFHKPVHVVQRYGFGGQSCLTEGIADYLRWAIFEDKPQEWFPLAEGERMYRQGYRACGGFLLWLESNRSPGIVKKLNAALRNGRYTADIFKEEAGLELDELWKTYLKDRRHAIAIKQERWQLKPFEHPVKRPVIEPRKDNFDSLLTEVGPPAVVTDYGIVLFYNDKNSRADETIGKGACAAGHSCLIQTIRCECRLTATIIFSSRNWISRKVANTPMVRCLLKDLLTSRINGIYIAALRIPMWA